MLCAPRPPFFFFGWSRNNCGLCPKSLFLCTFVTGPFAVALKCFSPLAQRADQSLLDLVSLFSLLLSSLRASSSFPVAGTLNDLKCIWNDPFILQTHFLSHSTFGLSQKGIILVPHERTGHCLKKKEKSPAWALTRSSSTFSLKNGTSLSGRHSSTCRQLHMVPDTQASIYSQPAKSTHIWQQPARSRLSWRQADRRSWLQHVNLSHRIWEMGSINSLTTSNPCLSPSHATPFASLVSVCVSSQRPTFNDVFSTLRFFRASCFVIFFFLWFGSHHNWTPLTYY